MLSLVSYSDSDDEVDISHEDKSQKAPSHEFDTKYAFLIDVTPVNSWEKSSYLYTR